MKHGRTVAFTSLSLFDMRLGMTCPHSLLISSDHGGVESTFFDDKFGDESSWGANFDTHDDIDSVWGFNSKVNFYQDLWSVIAFIMLLYYVNFSYFVCFCCFLKKLIIMELPFWMIYLEDAEMVLFPSKSSF